MLLKVGKMLILTFVLSINAYSTPAQVIIVRHGEKPDLGPDLSPKGFERAKALSVFFQTDSQVLEFGLPIALFAQKQHDINNSFRPIQTLTPTAHSLGLPIHAPFLTDQQIEVAQLILNESRYDGRMVLMSWEHDAMKALVTAFGAPTPPDYPSNRFDLIYKITFTDPANPTFCCGLQKLMKGDQDTVPAGFTACP